MASIKAHLFTTEQEAHQAIDLINKGEGIPVDENSVTTTYCMAQKLEEFYYICADEITEKYLGESVEIEIKSSL